ncbi:hypothetical protein [Saccharothrix sp.]|uniref:hypothetical protein n=1 Tax=Saccharothrix sp. TaxID=1873460 RepID=UPI002812535D|nr:hypothetical protein [Saccharothrix sp.]
MSGHHWLIGRDGQGHAIPRGRPAEDGMVDAVCGAVILTDEATTPDGLLHALCLELVGASTPDAGSWRD